MLPIMSINNANSDIKNNLAVFYSDVVRILDLSSIDKDSLKKELNKQSIQLKINQRKHMPRVSSRGLGEHT